MKKLMRVAVLSSTAFGHRCIEEGILYAEGVRLAGILTTPQEIEISYSESPVRISSHVTFDDLAQRAECEVGVLSGKVSSASYARFLQRWKPDLLCALGWYYMVPRQVRDMAPLGCVGIHASLLPKYRGGAPLVWAMIRGEKETGVSLFFLEEGVDTGDLLGQMRIPIARDDTIATVYERATEAAVELLRTVLPRVADGTAARTAQDESHATHVPQRSPEDGLIDWSQDAETIRDFIRAQTKPYPGAFTIIEGRKIRIWDADIEEVGN